MTDIPSSIAGGRPLSRAERDMVAMILGAADERARSFLPQLERARVVATCGCGCASIDFSIDGVRPEPGAGLEQLGNDFFWRGTAGGICGIFVFAKNSLLAGLETWSVDGVETPTNLPSRDLLVNDPSRLSGG